MIKRAKSLKKTSLSESFWQAGQDSNLQQTVLETVALPIELPTYKNLPYVNKLKSTCQTLEEDFFFFRFLNFG